MSERVLIVDDERDVTTYVATALRAHGYETSVANSVEDGLRLLAEATPDLVLLDIVMPRESGLSMYVRLKENPATRQIPVVILSGVAQKGQFDFRSYVADQSVPPPEHYLEKPVSVDELIEVIASFKADACRRSREKDSHG
jgi:two-component system phosphate regulon response regulator PhoB